MGSEGPKVMPEGRWIGEGDPLPPSATEAAIDEKVGDCWHCGGFVSQFDEHVAVASLVYHRPCARWLMNELARVLLGEGGR